MMLLLTLLAAGCSPEAPASVSADTGAPSPGDSDPGGGGGPPAAVRYM